MASTRIPKQATKPEAPEFRIELLDSDDDVLGFVPLHDFISEKGNTWYGVPDPRSAEKKAAHAQYGVTVASKLVGLSAGQLPDGAALYMDGELVDKVELTEGVTGSGNPKRHAVVNVDTDQGMRRFSFRISALPSNDDGDRHNLAGSVTRTGGGSGTVASW
jgi:hypothetical protein